MLNVSGRMNSECVRAVGLKTPAVAPERVHKENLGPAVVSS